MLPQDIISYERRVKSRLMNEKPLTDLKTFIENVNKKNKKHNGRKTRFSWVKKKRKN